MRNMVMKEEVVRFSVKYKQTNRDEFLCIDKSPI